MIKVLTALLVTLPLLAASASPADLEPGEESVSTVAFTDPAGDANFVNDQGTGVVPIDDAGPDTRPASVDSADLVEGRYETTYVSVPEHDEDGRMVAIRRVPTGLRIHLETTRPPWPSFGPTVALELWAASGDCPITFGMHAHGQLSSPADPPQGAELRTRSVDCPGGVSSVTEGLRLDRRGTVAVLEFPFSALDTPEGPILQAGDVVGPDPSGTTALSSTVHGTSQGVVVGGPVIDRASPVEPFEIGSDVPPDVDCLETPTPRDCLPDDVPDTGEDLHATLLGSGNPIRTGPVGEMDLTEEYLTYSFRPDGRWMTFGFDIAAAGFTKDWVRIELAARLIGDGELSDEWFGFPESFANWKLIWGPAEDPFRNMASMVHDTPWGATLSLPADGLDRLTLLGTSDVRTHSDVGLVIGVQESDEGFLGEPFPDAFAQWVQSWTEGKRKVRAVEDHWGHGAELALWLGSPGGTSQQHRRGLTIQDERPRISDMAGPGTFRMSTAFESEGPALTTGFLTYGSTGAQDVTLEWRTPAETRRASELQAPSSGASFSALSARAGPGAYGSSLELDSIFERPPVVTYSHDFWPLDPDEVFPGMPERFTSNPDAEPVVLTPGDTVSGAAPALVVSPVSEAAR